MPHARCLWQIIKCGTPIKGVKGENEVKREKGIKGVKGENEVKGEKGIKG
jgi:hypothetical protein